MTMTGERAWVVAVLTALTMAAFAANSILCRLALTTTGIDPAGFTLIRIVSGSIAIGALVLLRGKVPSSGGSWRGAAALLAYAAAFSFAYSTLTAGTGALLLFGAVQATMIVAGLVRGERLGRGQWCGLVCALAGLVVLVAPGVSAPPLAGALLMASSGVAWGWYSLVGRKGGDPTVATAGNFLRAVPMAAGLALVFVADLNFDSMGMVYGVLSGAVTSGLGYGLWYAVLPALSAVRGASVQLSVPVITAGMAVAMLGEPVDLRLILASATVLGGIALVIAGRKR